ncbi:hypothetical protein WDZ92_06440 [Nostoc sp. NIES-2111]
MSNKSSVGGQGNFTNFEDLLSAYKNVSKELPPGVRFKLQSNKYLLLQFKHPGTDKRLPKPCGVDFTFDGIYEAKKKAFKVRTALDTIQSATAFWEWYDKEILGINEIINDFTTYREIFEKIEARYWNGRNKNTKRKRSKDIPNDVRGFEDQYGKVFRKFTNWDNQPSWDEIKGVLFTWEQGSKTFKDVYTVIKQICFLCPNNERLLEQLADIDYRQKEFKERQSISLESFLEWHDNCLTNTEERHQESKESWLWVASMCVVYGLRPSEVAAAINLETPYTKDDITVQAINNPNNRELLLVLSDKTYFGTTIKTGARVCRPMVVDRELIKRLRIQKPRLPEYKPNKTSSAKAIVNGFANNLTHRLTNWKCPITQAYAFRHLANQLGEKYGIPQEIRARSLGHSVAVNDSVYKKRSNLQTSIDLLTNHSKQPLSYDAAIQELKRLNIDIDSPSVKAILRVIYQLE